MDTTSRYLRCGPEALGATDLLETLVGQAAAAALLEHFGSLAAIGRAPAPMLARVPACGPVRAARLHASFEVARRAALESAPPRIRSASDAAAWLVPVLANLAHEELHALYLSRQGVLVARRCASRGGQDRTLFDPRWIAAEALRVGASSIIVAHNHPSGDPEPSAEDHAATRRLCEFAKGLGLDIVDHIVVGGSRWISMAARAELPTPGPAAANGTYWVS